jgi:ketosteroid isomerase-like protein
MRRALLLLVMLCLAVPAQARPMDPATQRQLLAVFTRYDRAIEAGNIDRAMALRTDDVRAAVTPHLQNTKDRADFLVDSREMVPDQMQVRHASINDAGDKALLILLASKMVSGQQAQDEFDLAFARQGGEWKLAGMLSAPGPADVKRCPDQSSQPASAYTGGQTVSLAGRIERVLFLPDHTLVLLTAGDTEVCAFLPDRAALRQHGMNPAIIQPWRVVAISGVAEKNDPQKVLVNNIEVHEQQ